MGTVLRERERFNGLRTIKCITLGHIDMETELCLGGR